jgi:hypothetical protein
MWAWQGNEISPGATSVSVAPSAMLPAGLPSCRKRMLCRPLIISRTSTSSALRTFACRIASRSYNEPPRSTTFVDLAEMMWRLLGAAKTPQVADELGWTKQRFTSMRTFSE